MSLVRLNFSQRLVIDTNLLLLLVVAEVDHRQIGNGRLSQFSEDDVVELNRLARKYRQIVSTPHILTEVSNLLDHGLAGKHRKSAALLLKSMIERNAGTDQELIFRESQYRARRLMTDEAYLRFGLTDAALGQLARRGDDVVTADARLAAYLASRWFRRVINFNHLRQSRILDEGSSL